MFLFTQEELFLPVHSMYNCQLFSFSFERCPFYNKKYREWEVELKLRVKFSYSGTSYNLPVTDVDFLQQYQEEIANDLVGKTVYLTISISNEFEGLYYKLAAGVIII